MERPRLDQLHVGKRVRYAPDYLKEGDYQMGIIKEIPEDVDDPLSPTYNSVRVVYNCADDWENYENYTSALTHISDLKLGWVFLAESSINSNTIKITADSWEEAESLCPVGFLIIGIFIKEIEGPDLDELHLN